MNTQLTVGDLRTQFGSLFSPSEFIPYLNQALAQIITSGRWKGSQVYAFFPTSSGYITLPYELSSIMGISMGGMPVPVFTNQHEYLISGPGNIDETKPATGIVDYINDGFATRIDPPVSGCTLRIVLDLAIDIGKTFRFYGRGATRTIYDINGEGMNITTTGLTTNEATVFEEVTGIEVPVDATGASAMIGGWTLYAVDGLGNATELSYYYPNETRPSYARYKTGTWNEQNQSTRMVIRTLCQRRFIPVAKDTDWVIPGNTRAIKAAMQAVQCEDANNYDQAAPLWVMAYKSLNDQVHSARGAAKPEISIPQAQYDASGFVWGVGSWGNWGGWGT